MPRYTSPVTNQINNAAGTTVSGWWWTLRALRNALIGAGMVQTTDAGQVDFTLAEGNGTTPVVLTTGSLSGYFIMRLNDPLQATKPFFIKIRLFMGSGNSSVAGLHVQYGSGTDGAGNLTGYASSGAYLPWVAASAGANHVIARTTYGSGNATGEEIVVSWHEVPNLANELSALLQIERTRDETGAYDGLGVLINLTFGGLTRGTFGAYAYHGVFPTDGSSQPLGYGFNRDVVVPKPRHDRYTYVDGNNIGPLLPYGGGFFPKFRQSHTAFLLPHADMVTYGNVFTMPIYGVNRTFRVVGWTIPYYVVMNHHGGTNTGGDIELQRLALAYMWEA